MIDLGTLPALRLAEVYVVWILGMLAVAMWRAVVQRRHLQRTAPPMSGIREALVTYLSGNENLEPLRQIHHTGGSQLGDEIMAFEGTVAGVARDRLCGLTIEFAIIHAWAEDTRSRDPIRRRTAFSRLAFLCAYEPCRRIVGDTLLAALEDPDYEVRLAAARAVLQSAVGEEIDEVFLLTLSQNLLVRVLLAEDLRRHAGVLCERAIPKSLESNDPAVLAATLDMLLAWERALPVTGLARLVGHRDRDVRLRALRLAPLASQDGQTEGEIIRALSDPDLEICCAAARAAGRMHLDQALPLLARCVRQGLTQVALEAAFALAEIRPAGEKTLEELSRNDKPATAAAAAEALAYVRSQAGGQ